MGKPQRAKRQQNTEPKKGKKKPQFNKGKQSDDQQVDDVMAWGRKKQNYYKQDEDEYSSLSEQQKEAAQIYNNKYDNYLNDEQAYDIPVEKQDQQAANEKKAAQLEENLDDDEPLPQQYITQQLQWIIQLFKDLEFYQENDLLKIYEKLLKSYLTVMISIKELKIPYIQYHPIIPMAVDIKTKITLLMKKLTVKQDEQEQVDQRHKKNSKNKKSAKNVEQESEDDEEIQSDDEQMEGDFDDEEDMEDEIGEEDEQFEEDDILQGGQWDDQSEEKVTKHTKKSNKSGLKPYPDHCSNATKLQNQEHKKGLEFYNEMKQALEQEKKQKKQQKRQQRKQNKKPAFKQIGQNEGRFASELILKNKGLIKKRKKIEGNSRLKLRKKYQKKKSIHRARYGHFIRENPGRAYEGESNIRTGKIAGVRLK